MYVPGKYLPLLLVRQLTPKEALLAINAEAVAQNEQDALKLLIEWLRAAVKRARTLPPTLPIMEAKFARKQRAMAERDLSAWNRTNLAPGGGTAQSTGTSNQAQAPILQSLQAMLLQAQNQGTVLQVARRVKKPSKQWEGTIGLLLCLVGVTAEIDLPPLWHAWSNCNKKESRTILQERAPTQQHTRER
jgi:hypothetical protein